MKMWTGKTFEITDRWGVGGPLWLVGTKNENMTFELCEDGLKPLNGSQGYRVQSTDNHMQKPPWNHAWLHELTSFPTQYLAGIPAWADRHPSVESAYNDQVKTIYEELRLGQRQCPVLMGQMAVDYKNEPRIDTIRMLYIANAIQLPRMKTPSDLVFVLLDFGDEVYSTRENGGGSGPPH